MSIFETGRILSLAHGAGARSITIEIDSGVLTGTVTEITRLWDATAAGESFSIISINFDEPTTAHDEPGKPVTLAAEAIADSVLANHAIQPHWARRGEQIRDLLIEAVTVARSADPGVTLAENYLRSDADHAAERTANRRVMLDVVTSTLERYPELAISVMHAALAADGGE